MRSIAGGLFATLLLCLAVVAARAEDVVVRGSASAGGRALVNRPAGPAVAALVLLPGGDGRIGIGADGGLASGANWIARTRGAYVASGIASVLVDAGVPIDVAIAHARTLSSRVVVVAMSRGATRVEGALDHRVDGVVFASAVLDEARAGIGDPARLPPSLLVHHRQDLCAASKPEMAAPFLAWAGGRARIVWIDGGTSQGNPCRPFVHHGFVGREPAVAEAIVAFATTLR